MAKPLPECPVRMPLSNSPTQARRGVVWRVLVLLALGGVWLAAPWLSPSLAGMGASAEPWFLGLGLTSVAVGVGLLLDMARSHRQALEACATRCQGIAEHLPQGLLVVDAEGLVCSANKPARDWFPDLAEGREPPCHEMCTGEAVCCICQQVRQTSTKSSTTMLLPTAQGRLRFQVTASPTEGGNVLLLLEDDTERRDTEERYHRALRLEAMGALATGVAHEINQPLTVMQMTSSTIEMLLERGETIPTERLLQRIRRISSETARISEIIGHMRALAHHKGDGDLSEVAINATVEAALGLARAQLAAHGIRLRTDLHPKELTARADPLQLEQVLLSLITHRLHALDGLQEEEKRIHLRTTAKAGGVLIQVADATITPNASGDDVWREVARGGTESGLSLAELLVNRWGGRFEVRHAAGGEVLFNLHLPASESEAGGGASEGSSEEAAV